MLIGQVAGRWETALTAWRTRATTGAARLEAAATTYEQTDTGSAQTFGHISRAL